MEIKELRIGNAVYSCSKEGREVIVCRSIDSSGINPFNNDSDCIWFREGVGEFHIEPIPLTEEWLIKFGFHRHHADYSNGVIYLKNVPGNDSFVWGVYPDELGSGFVVKGSKLIKYVHTLQNLYYSLIQEEL